MPRLRTCPYGQNSGQICRGIFPSQSDVLSLRKLLPNHNSHTLTLGKDLGQFRMEAVFLLWSTSREELFQALYLSRWCAVSWSGWIAGVGECERRQLCAEDTARPRHVSASVDESPCCPARGHLLQVLTHGYTGRLKAGLGVSDLVVATGFPTFLLILLCV